MMLSKDPLQSVWFIIFYQILSYFEDNVIYPRVVGNSVGLPGLWVLLSIFVFGDLWGVFGMIMSVCFLYGICESPFAEAEADCNRGNRVSGG